MGTRTDDDTARPPELVPGTELLGASPDEDGRFLARRGDGQVVRMPWLLYRVAELLDGVRDHAAVADEIGAQDGGRAHTAEDVRLVVERRLVPAGLVVPPAPTGATGGVVPAGGTPAVAEAEVVEQAEPAVAEAATERADEPRPAAPNRSRTAPVVPLLLAALVLVVATAAVTTLLARPSAPDTPVADAPTGPPAVTAPGGITGPPTLLGRVVEVPDATSAVVDVGGRPLRVDVAGLVPGTPACGAADARAFASRTLQGQEVTLVPDPTLPPPSGDVWRAYLVLGSQQSYTDAAIGAGWARAGEGRYREGFLAGQTGAQQAERGLWGPPCRLAS